MTAQITATLPTLNFPKEADYPTQNDWADFNAAAELNFGILGGDWSAQMQLWKTEANAMSVELNNNANIAQSIANYQGDWTSRGYTLGQSVSVSGVFYICKLTHTTGQNPTDSGSIYWNLALGNWNLKADKDMSSYTGKTTPVAADLLALGDSTSSFSLKKLTWANLKTALFGSPALTGTPTAPTAPNGTNSAQIATTAFVANLNSTDVKLTGDQTIAGVKTFSSSPIVPNATTATQAMAYGQGVDLTSEQTIAGVKTFSSSPIVPVPTLVNQAISMGNIIEKTGVGLGYGTGSGGTVTQLTSKGTNVTLNKPTGKIIMNNESLAAGATVQFNVSNALIGIYDIVEVSFGSGTFTNYSYNIWINIYTVGGFTVLLKNITGGPRSESVVINFVIIKGANS